MRWISVKERLPEPGRANKVDVWSTKRGRIPSVHIYHTDAGVPLWQDEVGVYAGREDVTHWMPIPAPPGDEGWTVLDPPRSFRELVDAGRIEVGTLLRVRWNDSAQDVHEESLLVGDVNTWGGYSDRYLHLDEGRCQIIAMKRVWWPPKDPE